VVPVSTDFTWVNQGSAAVSDNSYGMVMSEAKQSSVSLRLLVRSTPTPPYEIITRMTALANFGANPSAGMAWRDSATDKIHYFRFVSASSTKQWVLSAYASATSFSSNSAFIYYGTDPTWWIRLRDDSTNRYCDISKNGYDWVQIFSVVRTSHITPDQYGFCFDNAHSNGSTEGLVAHWQSWEEA
jgi:hypothetical protein